MLHKWHSVIGEGPEPVITVLSFWDKTYRTLLNRHFVNIIRMNVWYTNTQVAWQMNEHLAFWQSHVLYTEEPILYHAWMLNPNKACHSTLTLSLCNSPCMMFISSCKGCSNYLQWFADSLNPPSRIIFLFIPFSATVAIGLLFKPDNVRVCEGKLNNAYD